MPEASAPEALAALLEKSSELGGSVVITASREGWGPRAGKERKFQSSAVLYRRSDFTKRVLLSVAGLVAERREWWVARADEAEFQTRTTDDDDDDDDDNDDGNAVPRTHDSLWHDAALRRSLRRRTRYLQTPAWLTFENCDQNLFHALYVHDVLGAREQLSSFPLFEGRHHRSWMEPVVGVSRGPCRCLDLRAPNSPLRCSSCRAFLASRLRARPSPTATRPRCSRFRSDTAVVAPTMTPRLAPSTSTGRGWTFCIWLGLVVQRERVFLCSLLARESTDRIITGYRDSHAAHPPARPARPHPAHPDPPHKPTPLNEFQTHSRDGLKDGTLHQCSNLP